jgi:nucleotide-binding universal stress UspA family protein
MISNNTLPKIGFEKILYITDLSESGRLAFPYAASLAHKYGANLTVFHVVEAHDFEKYLVGYISEALWNEIRNRDLKEARKLLIERKREDAAIKHSVEEMYKKSLSEHEHEQAYVTYDVVVEMGDPVDKILEMANSKNYDLLIMGKHGHGALKGALIGDTCQHVVRRCQKPVLVVEVPPKEEG